jgi:hypothetical protein
MIIDQSSIQGEDGQQLFIVGDECGVEGGGGATAIVSSQLHHQQHQYQILQDSSGENDGGGLLVLNGNGDVASAGAAVYYMPATEAGGEGQLMEVSGGGQVLAAMAADGRSVYTKQEVSSRCLIKSGSVTDCSGSATLVSWFYRYIMTVLRSRIIFMRLRLLPWCRARQNL